MSLASSPPSVYCPLTLFISQDEEFTHKEGIVSSLPPREGGCYPQSHAIVQSPHRFTSPSPALSPPLLPSNSSYLCSTFQPDSSSPKSGCGVEGSEGYPGDQEVKGGPSNIHSSPFQPFRLRPVANDQFAQDLSCQSSGWDGFVTNHSFITHSPSIIFDLPIRFDTPITFDPPVPLEHHKVQPKPQLKPKVPKRGACHGCKVRKIRCYPDPEDPRCCMACHRAGRACDFSPPPVGSRAYEVGLRRRQQRDEVNARRRLAKPRRPYLSHENREHNPQTIFLDPISEYDFAKGPLSVRGDSRIIRLGCMYD